jgi:hypothetical protein
MTQNCQVTLHSLIQHWAPLHGRGLTFVDGGSYFIELGSSAGGARIEAPNDN